MSTVKLKFPERRQKARQHISEKEFETLMRNALQFDKVEFLALKEFVVERVDFLEEGYPEISNAENPESFIEKIKAVIEGLQRAYKNASDHVFNEDGSAVAMFVFRDKIFTLQIVQIIVDYWNKTRTIPKVEEFSYEIPEKSDFSPCVAYDQRLIALHKI